MATPTMLEHPRTASEQDVGAPRYAPAGTPNEPRLLIATDGTPIADAAVRIGRALAERDGATAELLTVFEPPQVYATGLAHAGAAGAELSLKRTLWEQLQAQRHRVAPEATRWPVSFEVGHPAQAIARAAREGARELIVLGLHAHNRLERYLGRETALQVVRLASVPVLAVAPQCTRRPSRVLVALDFSPSSVRAARAALALLGGSGTLYLAHVTPRVRVPLGEPQPWEIPYGNGVRSLFDVLERGLDAPPGVTVQRVSLDGDPANALLAFAAQCGVDLVAAGSHGYSAFARALLGSVSTRLMRGAHCSVLIAPPAARG